MDVSILTLKTLRELKLQNKILSRCVILKTYCGKIIKTLGSVLDKVNYAHLTREKTIEFIVVKKGENVLDLDDCLRLEFIKILEKNKEVFTPEASWGNKARRLEKENVIRPVGKVDSNKNKYNKILNNKIYLLSNYYFSIKLLPNIVPFIGRERPIPFALRSLVETELNSLIKKGILIKSINTDWVSPIVVIKKANCQVCVCGDFRMLNKAIQDDKYPLPPIEDLLARLSSRKQFFAKIFLKAAYYQIQLTEESSSLTTIIMHLGTFRYNRMPFGIKSASSAFLRIIDKFLEKKNNLLS